MNEFFLSEFEFFKNNVKEYENKFQNLMTITVIISILSVIVTFILIAHDILEIYYFCFNLIAAVIASISVMIFVEHKNKRKNEFYYNVYKGSLSELFTDMNHPAITSRKDRLKEVFEYKKGFSGSIVFEIYLDILNGEAIKKQEELKKEELIMHELNMIK